MKRSELQRLWPLCLACAVSVTAFSQADNDGSPAVRSSEAAKTAAEAIRMLDKARQSSEAELGRRANEAPEVKRLGELADRVQKNPPKQDDAEQARQAESESRLRDAMSRVSPEGKALLAQSAAAPALRAPVESGSGTTKASPLSGNTPGPKPQPLKSITLDAPAGPQVRRTIIDANSSFFDSRAGFGVFVDDVVVDHPDFHLTGDELEVYMNKEEPAKAGTAADPKAPTAGQLAAEGAAQNTPAQGNTGGDSSIKQAIARGRRVLINKMSAKGVPQIGVGREAVYFGSNGDMILRGWPQIQEGKNLTVATEASTYFVIKANGQFQAMGGRAQTRIIQDDKKNGNGQNDAAPGAATTTAGTPAPVLKPAPTKPGNAQ